MKKKILIIIFVIIVLFIVIKIREVLILNKVYKSIENFAVEENRYYSSYTIVNENVYSEKRIYVKQNVEKYVLKNTNSGEYCEWKNFETGEVNVYNMTDKIKYENTEVNKLEEFLMVLPNLISFMHINNGLTLFQLLKVYYIIPITYENKPCYKISTTSEFIIIEKDTYLPVYSSVKIINSTENYNKTENTYGFEINTVTDENIALPNFEEYEKK